ncbi:MAG TPA: ATP-binding domain-containing protein [Acidimicrobiia bacterium]|nr:ATP-binding domain-containing protein [Acidimicrobiia bacterium]
MSHPDLGAEQRHFDRLYQKLDEEIAHVEGRLQDVRVQRVGGHGQARFERDAFAGHLEDRMAAFRAHRRDDLCFGRIDLDDGRRFYIGRLGLSDDDHEPLLVDWRAPAAAPFYQATPREPMGVVRRRHFLTRERRILGIEDDVLDADGLSESEADSLRGEAALQYAMGSARTGRMREIAATIQREQDEIIRAPLTPVVFVQGGPGTGKTAVALHRAAYLLYTHRRRLSASDVIVVGPNPLFLRYIDQVLPSLGENGADLTSVPGVYARREWNDEPRHVRAIKTRPQMAQAIANAIATRRRPIRKAMDIDVEGVRVLVTPQDTREILGQARGRRGRHNAVALHVHDRLVRLLWRRAGTAASNVMEYEDFRLEMLTSRRFRRLSMRVWPTLTPEQLLNDLFGFPALRREATRGVLSDADATLLVREWSPRVEDARWSHADAALLDEAADRLGPIPSELDPTARRRAEALWTDDEETRAEAEYTRQLLSGLGGGIVPRSMLEQRAGLSPARARGGRDDDDDLAATSWGRTWRYAVVDEAQDLSPMEWSMVGRHAPRRAATVVGDLAQGTEPWSARNWEDVRQWMGAPPDASVSELTINYRTPTEVAAFAARVLALANPRLSPPASVRSVADSLVFVEAAVNDAGLGEPAATEALAARERLGDGIAGVIVAPSSLEPARAAVEARLGRALPALGDPTALDAPIAVMTPALSKGLEFDVVVVADPGAVADELGWGALYVACTRATQRLIVVHPPGWALPEPTTTT